MNKSIFKCIASTIVCYSSKIEKSATCPGAAEFVHRWETPLPQPHFHAYGVRVDRCSTQRNYTGVLVEKLGCDSYILNKKHD